MQVEEVINITVVVDALVHATVACGVVAVAVTWDILKSHNSIIIVSTWTRHFMGTKLRNIADNNLFDKILDFEVHNWGMASTWTYENNDCDLSQLYCNYQQLNYYIQNYIWSVTEEISAFVDLHLRKFIPRIPSYDKDTTHFINIIKNIPLEPQGIHITIDISSLYTNIPHTDGIVAINKMMEGTGTDPLFKMLISILTYQVLTKILTLHNKVYSKIAETKH